MKEYLVVYRINRPKTPVVWNEEVVKAPTLFKASDKFFTSIERLGIAEFVDYVWFKKGATL